MRVSERSEEFPFSDIQTSIRSAVNNFKGKKRHHANNAFRHIIKAWRLGPIDAEMAAFRAITAEEEAATALLLALKDLNYPHSERILPYRHEQKIGCIAFMEAIAAFYHQLGHTAPRIAVQPDVPSVKVFLPGTLLGMSSGNVELPDPLDLVVSQGTVGKPGVTVSMFQPYLQSVATKAGKASFKQMAADEANFRNRLLYAAEDGVTVVNNPDQMIAERASRVGILLFITIAVVQVRRPQLFAVQALEAFLLALGATKLVPYNFDDHVPKM